MPLFDISLLSYAGPPCIGAFIGYLTNKVAICMLFRPLRPWYVYGLKVPMTPGVIPSKRHDLAVNIGEMVGRHLLTSREIGAALSKEPFQEQLHRLIDRKVKEILNRELGTVSTFVPERFKAYFLIGLHTLKYRLGEGVNRYIASDDFQEKMTVSLLTRLDAVAGKELNTYLSPATRQSLYNLLDRLVADLLGNERTSQWLAAFLADKLRQAADRGHSVGDFLPSQLGELLNAIVREQSPAVLRYLASQLADPAVRSHVIKGIVRGIDQFLESLGPVGAMARGFLEVDTFEEKVAVFLKEREGDMVAWLENSEVQERMSSALSRNIEALLQTPLAHLMNKMEAEQLERLCQSLAGQLLAMLGTEGAQDGLRKMLRVALEELLAEGRCTLGELANRFLSEESGAQLRETLADEWVALFRTGKAEKLINNLVGTMVDALLSRPVGKLSNIVPQGVRAGITDYLHLTANRMLLQEVPDLADSLNIERVVADKVDSLDLLQLERLLLSIMEEQFKYINLFGGLLGFIIGLLNVVFLRLG